MNKHLIKKILAVSLSTAMATGMLVGVTESVFAAESNEEVTLTAIIVQSQNRPGLQIMFDKLYDEYNIYVDAQVVPDEQYLNLLQMKLASGELPDIIEYNIPHIFNVINPEEYLYDFSDAEWTEKLVAPEVTQYDGKQYGFPFCANSGFHGIIYNKDVFEENNLEVPTTVEEFDNVCETLKEAGVTPILLSNDLWVPQIWTASGFSRAMGSEEAAQEMSDKILTGQAEFNDFPQLAAVIDDLIAMNEKGYINDDISTLSYDDLWVELADGEGAMFLGENGFIGQNQEAFPDAHFGMFNVPTTYDEKDIISAACFTQGFVVNKNTENIDAVNTMLNAFSTPEYADNLFSEGYAGIPGFQDVDGGTIQEDVMALYEEHQNNGTVIPEMNSYWSEFESLYNDYLWTYYAEALTKHDMNGTEVLDKFQQDVNKYMKENGVEGF